MVNEKEDREETERSCRGCIDVVYTKNRTHARTFVPTVRVSGILVLENGMCMVKLRKRDWEGLKKSREEKRSTEQATQEQEKRKVLKKRKERKQST